jgi:PKD repeat protein
MKTISRTTAALLFALVGHFSFAQTQDIPHVCGSHEVMEQRKAEDSKYARAIENINARAIQNLQNIAERSDEIYTIPVVVHVIHEGENYGVGSNITDEQVLSAIAALNEDFRKMTGTNGDGNGVDSNLEFCLATRDPNGNSTNGIMRVDGSVVADYADQGIEANGGLGASEEDVKALSTWPREDYMNVWVVNEIEDNNAQGGIQGYAYFPFDNPVDGIAILHNAFGTVGNLKSNTDMNRTLTHEVGHYLSLYHTFHLTNDCDDEINCENQGDKVCDTPKTVLNGSCSQPACEGTQQVENYMDYTQETCRDMFTEGQKLRMRSALETSRASILESMGCVPATDRDAGITNVSSPSGSLCDNTISPVITITNFGSETLTSVTVNYRVDAGTIHGFDWTGSVNPGASTTIELPQISSTMGEHTFIAYTNSPNNQSDENPANDQISKSFEIANGASLNLEVNIDYFGTETSWSVTQSAEVLASGGPYVDYQQGNIYNHEVCLTEGCYELVMEDAHGDGQGFQTGYFELTDSEGNVFAFGEDDWGDVSTNPFCIEVEVSEELPVASFGVSDNSVCTGESINLNDLSTNNPTSWSWNVEGIGTFSSQNVSDIVFENAGDYNITLTASNEFGSSQATQTVTVSDGPSISLSSQDILCAGDNNGSISANVSGGTSPYNYDWSNNASSAVIQNLSAGQYTLTATDNTGCENTATAVIAEPEALNLTVFKSDITCFGLQDGTATASASGGTAPYSFEWNNEANSNAISDLAEGSVSVTATDANGCTSSGSVEIVEPSALAVNTSMTAPESCAGNDGSGLVNVMGGTPNYSYNWSNGASEQSVSNLASGDYTITVSDANGCVNSGVLEVPFDCDQTVDGTQLDETHCGMSELTLDDQIMCEPIDGAEMYQWKFSNLATGFFAEEYTIGANNTFQLSNLMDMRYGQIYEVRVRVMKEEIWSAYGQTCTIQLSDQVPQTGIMANHCDQQIFQLDETINCQAVTGALKYTFRFVNGENEVTAESSQPQLLISANLGIEFGLTYDVSVKATVATDDSEYGSSCPLQINNTISVGNIGDSNLVIYPNPSNGEQMNLEFSNLFTDKSVIEFGMYDMAGKIIESFAVTVTKPTSKESYTFRSDLAPGMYFLQYEMNGNAYKKKLIVQ